jgi:hypothetical protein
MTQNALKTISEYRPVSAADQLRQNMLATATQPFLHDYLWKEKKRKGQTKAATISSS